MIKEEYIKRLEKDILRLEMENAEAKADNFEQSTVIQNDDFDWKSYIENYNNNGMFDFTFYLINKFPRQKRFKQWNGNYFKTPL